MAECEVDQPSSKKARANFIRRGFTSTPTAPVVKDGNSTEPVSVTLTDAQLLDCPICVHPLSSPVYQCEKGHVACSRCCIKVHSKCPFCSGPIGNIRNLFAERIVESATVDCENSVHGCKEKLVRGNKATHQKTCTYAPCCCPYPDCEFAGFSQSMYEHFSKSHSAGRCFSFGSEFDLVFSKSEESVILQETDKKVVFVVTRSRSSEPRGRGSIIQLICISPNSPALKRYHSRIQCNGPVLLPNTILLSGPVDCVQKCTEQLPTTASLLVPKPFVGANGHLKLQVIITRPCELNLMHWR